MARVCKCPINPSSEYYARTMRGEVVGLDALLSYARRHKMLYKDLDCGGVIADFRPGGAGLLASLPAPARRFTQPRKRVPVIRSVANGTVAYRFFGESYGLAKEGVNVAAIAGFTGTGSELSQRLNVPPAALATSLHLPLDEFLKTSFDVSKD